MRTVTLAVMALALPLPSPLHAQQPTISNAQLRTASAASGLEGAVRTAIAGQPGPAWIGWAVPKIPGEHRSCCWSDQGVGCGLERRPVSPGTAPTGPVQLEGPTHIAILLRVEQGALGKIRHFTIDCPLDAGGLPVQWLSDVRPAESVALLLQHMEIKANQVLGAIAMHAAPEAESALERLAANGPSVETRKQALFWLGNSRGQRGFQVVSRMLREDPSDAVREHAVFVAMHTQNPAAVPLVIKAAKEDKSPRVRGQALFWLAQKASRQAESAITESIERDPETEVKKKAVFALSRLPASEGVPALIRVARENQNPAVRKQAMFWLGQSKDPRALEFLEQVLVR